MVGSGTEGGLKGREERETEDGERAGKGTGEGEGKGPGDLVPRC